MSIAVHDLSYSYGRGNVFEHVNLSIERGGLLSILGPNGAGKTTLLNALAGLTPPTSGEILYEGRPHRSMNARSLAELIGYVPQTMIPAFDYSVLEYVVTGCAPRIGTFERPKREHYDAAMRAIDMMGIAHLSETSYRQISGGERQQVSIARVLAQKPAFILMDEPTAHLDYGNQLRTLKMIRSLGDDGYAVVFTTHNPDHVLMLGGQVAVIDRQGQFVSGDCADIVNERVLSALYGVELRLAHPADAAREICYSPGL